MSDDHGDRARLNCPVASFKALDSAKGEFEALVSVFGNVDFGGDRILPGAFAKTLGRWQEKGDPIPFMWDHQWKNPEAIIGSIDPDDAVETEDGLVVKGRIDLDNPFAKQIYRLLADRRLKEFSFGYDLKDSEREGAILNLLEIDLFEVSTTFKGMNPDTELLAVKALADVTKSVAPAPEIKAGARHSKETRSALVRMRAELDALLAADLDALLAADEVDETPKSDEAEAMGKASDPDADIKTRIALLQQET